MDIMRNIVAILALAIMLLNCKEKKEAMGQDSDLGYVIHGSTNVSQGFAYLQKYNAENEMHVVDSVSLSDNSFVFHGQVEHLEPYQVVVNENVYPLVLENDEYQLLEGIFVGTSFQDEYNRYYEGLRKTENPFVYQRNFITSNPESLLAAVVLKTMLGKTAWRIDQNRLAYEALDRTIQQTGLGKEIQQFIAKQEGLIMKEQEDRPAEVASSGTVVKDIEMPTPKAAKKEAKNATSRDSKLPERAFKGIDFEADDINGNIFRLSEIASNSKYILIDFWASWCAPCRTQNPYLVEVYNLYHDKGFDIVSVSEDRSKDNWRKAVDMDGLIWHQVIDDFSRLTKLYGVESIPHTVLINREGEIIASDISPFILKNKLSGLLRN